MSRQSNIVDVKATLLDCVNTMAAEAAEIRDQNGAAGTAGGVKSAVANSLSRLIPLTQAHTTAVDINGEDRGRVKRILEGR